MVQTVFILSLIVLVYGAYFAITGLFAFRKNKTYIGSFPSSTRFAVLVPARNEESVIGDLLESLNDQDYPEELYTVYAVINNCTDGTKQRALEAGAKIIECEGKITCKGDVLKYAFKNLESSDHDAYVIFDADNVVHPGFLSAMNNVYASGHKVGQGRKDSKNMGDNWISASFFYNRARTHMGAAATINGTGFMVAKEVVDDGFDPHTVTEDIELALISLLKGYKVVYTDGAVTYDEQPTDFRTAWHQRKRWSRGIIQCLVRYSGPLFKCFITKGDFSSLDKILFTVSPIMQIFALVPTAMTVVIFAGGFARGFVINSMMFSTVAGLVIGYMITVVMCVFTIISYRQSIKEGLSGIFMFMIFMLTWIPINICCNMRKNHKWVPVKHCRSVRLEELIAR